MGHLNSFLASGGGKLNKNFPKIQMPGGLPAGGMLKLRFDWYIITILLNNAISLNYFTMDRKDTQMQGRMQMLELWQN